MRKLIVCFLLLMQSAFAHNKVDEIRILNLLPDFVSPPMVNPALPEDFHLIQQKDDPYFSKGYFWGSKSTLESYFDDLSKLNGCIIRAELSPYVIQTGPDKFSNDGNTQGLTAAGFTEISVNKGRWGIFPYRELLSKGPKGRRHYQMWVGLNTPEGATLFFQFIYPEYLSEPTQTQKSVWLNFVKKTALLDLHDLMVAREAKCFPSDQCFEIKAEDFGVRVEKRRRDKKVLVYAENATNISIASIKEGNFLFDFPIGKRVIEINILLERGNEGPSLKTIHSTYKLVDHFSFDSRMLNQERFEDNGNFLFFY